MLRPEDFLVKVIVSWSGSLDATDPQMQMGKAMKRMQTVIEFGQPVGIVTPQNVFNMLQDLIDADPDVDVTSKYITSPQGVGMSQLSQQQEEIVRMLNGFDVPVSPDDDDNIHLQVIEEWASTPQGAASMQNEGIATLINKHTSIHIQSEQMKNGIQAQNSQGTQGKLGDPRASKVAKTSGR